jgi:hypothetical protein
MDPKRGEMGYVHVNNVCEHVRATSCRRVPNVCIIMWVSIIIMGVGMYAPRSADVYPICVFT